MDLIGHAPDEFFRLSPEVLREEYGLTAKAADAICGSSAADRDAIARAADRLESLDVSIITQADAHYPLRLEAFDPSPPPLLFVYGNTKLLDSKTFAVLCSNKPPESALDRIEELAERGVLSSETLVTGVNRREYQRAAVVPLRWGSPRVLCLDRGLFPTLGEALSEEPFPSARLWRYKFDKETDLAVSPVRPQTGFAGAANQIRDLLVCGLADRIDLVYVRPGGMMEKCMRLALAAGRQVAVERQCPNAEEYAGMGAALLG
jgi:DNA processing protein